MSSFLHIGYLIRQLNDLSGSGSEKKKYEIVRSLFEKQIDSKYTELILNLINKQLKIRVSNKTILTIIQKNKDLFTEDELAKIQQLFSEKIDDVWELFYPISPNLSYPTTCIDDFLNKARLLKAGRLLVEEKYDGERIQIF